MKTMNKLYIADIRSMNINGKLIGHYYPVAKNYYDIFKETYQVLIAGGPVYSSKFTNLYPLTYDTYKNKSVIINKLKVLKNMIDLFQHKNNEDIIIIQSSATATALIGIALLKHSQCKVFTIQYNKECITSPIKKFIYKLASHKISGIICPSEEIGQAYKRPYCVVPDYIYTGNNSKEEKTFNERTYDFSILGLLCKDKGVVETAQKFKNTQYKVLIAGMPQNEEIRQAILEVCKDCNNIELKLEYLSDDEYDKNIKESRYCILNYSGAYSEHSSGVVFDILFRGTPVIGRRCKYLSFIEEYHIGTLFQSINEFDPEIILKQDTYYIFTQNIKTYFDVHKNYISKLKNFLDNTAQ